MNANHVYIHTYIMGGSYLKVQTHTRSFSLNKSLKSKYIYHPLFKDPLDTLVQSSQFLFTSLILLVNM